MTYLFALIGVIAIGFLLWRAFGPQSEGTGGVSSGPKTTRGPLGPDDDQDFLRDLDNKTRGTNGSDGDDS
ncbi:MULTISPECIES: hypothetical protein [unclassified Gordonia (in: high G+C Gram-positive bacteria)]|uniref:hypothetical protein n=1 Tax=unclassified Gordonia (in: high G+C Gram-positive bacteria) TaxID=2657482 RepID=UPI001F115D34|nr:hypothetical protein [Gordonia sp. ABSL49_1]MCH5643928.1 hypothetical protein [Gordonia sp. ABSL49_1]